MKKNTYSIKTRQGVTLIELSVVIAVILTLLSVLFVGATYYKDAADKAACVINQNAIAKAADSVLNITGKGPADFDALTAAGGPLNAKPPVCPKSGTYTIAVSGSSYEASCNYDTDAHAPD